jgi:hypothetical protein
MSTRCQIGIYDTETQELETPTVLFYRHSDGYREAILEDLIRFCREFIKVRGWDSEYLPARLLCYLISRHTEDLPQQNGYKGVSEYGGFLGYGICKPQGFHDDIDFYYRIDPKAVSVYACNGDSPSERQLVEREAL